MKFSKGGVTIEIKTKLQASAFIQSGWKPVLTEEAGDAKVEAPVNTDNAAETDLEADSGAGVEADAEDTNVEAPKKSGRKPKETATE